MSAVPGQSPIRIMPPSGKCKAYKKDHTRCGVLCNSENAPYCPIHRNYARNWFSTHPPLYGIFESVIMSKSRVVREYIDQFSTDSIVPSREYVYKLPANYANHFYYLLLCEHSDAVDPLWNKNLFKDIVAFYFVKSITSTEKIQDLLKICKILAKNSDCLFHLYSLLLYYTMTYVLQYKDIIQNVEKQIEHIIGCVLELECWRDVALSATMNEIFDEQRGYVDIYYYKWEYVDEGGHAYLIHIMENILKPVHETWRSYMMGSFKSRQQVYVEELHAEAWHPRRVERWIEAYGLEDVFELM